MSTATELVRDVEQRIASGELSAGQRLPAVRAWAVELGIAPNTVAAAYRRLRERGVVVGRGRQGTIVAARTTVIAAPFVRVRDDLVDAASGNPDFSFLPVVTPQILTAAMEPRTRYGDAMITPHLLRAGKRWLAADGLVVERLSVVNGAMDAIERVLGARFSIGDRVAVEDPGHMPVHQIVAALGLVAVPVKVDESGMIARDLRQALQLGVSAVIVTPRAQNPTGAALSRDRAVSLQAELDTFPDVLVIEDDHAGPVSGVQANYLDHDRTQWCVVRSVAKSLGPDHRLALVAADDETLDRVEGRMQMGASWVSHFLQRIVAALLEDSAASDLVLRAAFTYTQRRERLVLALSLGGVPATGVSGLQVWIPVNDEELVIGVLRDGGYAIRGGAGYRIASGPAVRVTVAGLDDEQIDQVAGLLLGVLSPGRRRPSTTLSAAP